MSKEKVPFSQTIYYPVLFMIAVSLVFVGVLAVLYRSYEAKIEANKQNAYQLQIVQLLTAAISKASEIPEAKLLSDPAITYAQYISEEKGHPRRCFVAIVNGQKIAYCFDIGGQGLWGSMRALLALSPDLTEAYDLAVYDQMETPGLGSRITEEAFRSQFRGKKLLQNGKAIEFTLIPERQMGGSETQIRQITGATITTNSVLRMIKDEITIINSAKEAKP